MTDFCIGYNALYNVRTAAEEQLPHEDANADLPRGERVWNWLILCDDETVISVVEGRTHGAAGALNIVQGSRRNLQNVLKQLSRATSPETRNPMSLVPIRYSIDGDEDSANKAPIDESGLLFYYLFDDWYTTYSLVAKHRNQYGTELNSLVSMLY